MINELQTNDVVILSRFLEGGKDERNFVRKWSSYILNKITKLVLRSKINDLSSGIFVMKRAFYLTLSLLLRVMVNLLLNFCIMQKEREIK